MRYWFEQWQIIAYFDNTVIDSLYTIIIMIRDGNPIQQISFSDCTMHIAVENGVDTIL